MPIALSYPGVYVEEIPSGVRTVVGVATAITAFVGRTRRGSVNYPATINSFADFERSFGGLWDDSPLSFAVRDYFLNGGGQAVVVRLSNNAVAQTLKFTVLKATGVTGVADGWFALDAVSPGDWGNLLRASVDLDIASDALGGDPVGTVFNLTVRDQSTGGRTEVFRNLTLKDGPRRIDKVLAAQSTLARWGSTDLGKVAAVMVTAADDDVLTAEKAKQSVPATLLLGTNGNRLTSADFLPDQGEANKRGLYALERTDLFNLLCIPPHGYPDADIDTTLVAAAAAYAEKRRALLLVDPSSTWTTKDRAKTDISDASTDKIGTRSKNAALFFPRLRMPNPLRGNIAQDFAPCGAVAGVIARTDAERGVWKAPAGQDAALVGVPQLSVTLTDGENGELNPLAINCLRSMAGVGSIVWGARTLQGNDRLGSEWKYIPVRRLAMHIEESLYRGTQWAVFEPNGEQLWSQLRLNVGAFMRGLFSRGAFAGSSQRDAYFVKCDRDTTTAADSDAGIVRIVVGFAPLKPAEFVIIQLQQMAGQLLA